MNSAQSNEEADLHAEGTLEPDEEAVLSDLSSVFAPSVSQSETTVSFFRRLATESGQSASVDSICRRFVEQMLADDSPDAMSPALRRVIANNVAETMMADANARNRLSSFLKRLREQNNG